jgi:hypothetical protein
MICFIFVQIDQLVDIPDPCYPGASLISFEFKNIIQLELYKSSDKKQFWRGAHFSLYGHQWRAVVDKLAHSDKFGFFVEHVSGTLPVTIKHQIYVSKADPTTDEFDKKRGIFISAPSIVTWNKHNCWGVPDLLNLPSVIASQLYNSKNDSIMVKCILHSPQ